MSKKESSPKEQAVSKRRSKEGQVPTLVEVFFTISRLVVVVVGIVTAALSLYSGATFLAAAIRGGLAMLAIGLVMWLVTFSVSRGAYATARTQMLQSIQAAKGATERPTSRFNKEA